jgi:D-glycero-alpha-D-manno-heptose 1-phosphate guanylyltransferase
MEAIILAGGLGTRLKSVVSNVPKCMAPIHGIPFINFIITYLQQQGVQHFIFALGYKSDTVIEYVRRHYPTINTSFVVENTALGTGGAIQLAAQQAKKSNVLVLNGDTLFNINLKNFFTNHVQTNAHFSVALKPMYNFDRYGAVNVDSNNKLLAFNEKQFCTKGLINGGVYILNIPTFLSLQLPVQFSFEKAYMEKYIGIHTMYGITFNNYFIDIGIPTDYEQFATDYLYAVAQLKNKDVGHVHTVIDEAIFSLLN